MKVLFPDTNLFLQCKPIEQLPWKEISTDSILLLVSRPVQEEIDNFEDMARSQIINFFTHYANILGKYSQVIEEALAKD